MNKNIENKTGLNWVISSIDTSTAVDNTTYSYGDPVMPAKSSRKRNYVPYKYVPVPDNKRKRAKKCNKVSEPNKPYKRCKTSMKSTDALLENVKAVEPILAEKLRNILKIKSIRGGIFYMHEGGRHLYIIV